MRRGRTGMTPAVACTAVRVDVPVGAQTFLPESPAKVLVGSPFCTRILSPDW